MIHYTLVSIATGGAINIVALNNKEALKKYDLIKCKKTEAKFILHKEDNNYNSIQKIYCK